MFSSENARLTPRKQPGYMAGELCFASQLNPVSLKP
jgi:hypothetical protein